MILFAERMASVFLLSGTPAPNCPTEYWAQLRALSATGVAPNFYQFARKYFTPVMKRIHGRQIIERWILSKELYPRFLDILKTWSWLLSKADAVDLPSQRDVVREVRLSPRERGAYNEARRQLSVAGTPFAVEAALTKCRQLCGGFAYVADGPVTFGDSKLRELRALLDELGDEPAVIWADFRHDIDRIASAVGPCAVLDGRTKDADAVVGAFQRGDVRYLVAQPQTAGHGITLHRACYAVYYSVKFSFELDQQSKDRIHRTGQARPCTYYHLVSTDTVDETVLTVVQQKRSKANAIANLLRREVCHVA